MSKPLSPLQQQVFDVLNATPDTDVSIYDMFTTVYPKEPRWSVRHMQQRLGPAIQRLNDKLTDCRVTPGRLKQTYRLQTNE